MSFESHYPCNHSSFYALPINTHGIATARSIRKILCVQSTAMFIAQFLAVVSQHLPAPRSSSDIHFPVQTPPTPPNAARCVGSNGSVGNRPGDSAPTDNNVIATCAMHRVHSHAPRNRLDPKESEKRWPCGYATTHLQLNACGYEENGLFEVYL